MSSTRNYIAHAARGILCCAVLLAGARDGWCLTPVGSYRDCLAAQENIRPPEEVAGEHAEPESPLRRFEISFLISLPFVFAAHFLVLWSADVLIQGNTNVNVWKNHGAFLAADTLLITTIIAYREASIVRDANREREERSGRATSRTFYLSWSHQW
ncbi:MAG TPA: hypothetical protein PKM65_19820 [Spirochaetota bacterium]|nr:hypothetical protein [Spirochaetota bacterium]HNT11208.1 hypothetical protein [Spirochaetota bacterium]HNV46473.1 hypothetical protein [Spirochaetota bacterium]HOS38860.1 hypothetical protein [Spirochaetota bacterium]HPI21770.1 hypothetical protein [Spirochaetota bacterium]